MNFKASRIEIEECCDSCLCLSDIENINTMETSHNVPAAATAAQHEANLGLSNKDYGRNPEGVRVKQFDLCFINPDNFSWRSSSSDSGGVGGDNHRSQDQLRLR